MFEDGNSSILAPARSDDFGLPIPIQVCGDGLESVRKFFADDVLLPWPALTKILALDDTGWQATTWHKERG